MSPDLDALIEFVRQGDQLEREGGTLDRILAAALPVIRTFLPGVNGLVLYQFGLDGLQTLAHIGDIPSHPFPHNALALLLDSGTQHTLVYPAPEQAGPVLLLGQHDQTLTVIELVGADEPKLTDADREMVELFCLQLDGHIQRQTVQQSTGDGSLTLSADPLDMLRGLRDYAAPDASSLLLLTFDWDELTQDLTNLKLECRLDGQGVHASPTDLLNGLEPELIEALQAECLEKGQDIRCFSGMADWRAESPIVQLAVAASGVIKAAGFIPFTDDEFLRHAIIIGYDEEMSFSTAQQARFESARQQIAPVLEQRAMLQAAMRLNAQLGHQVRILQTAQEVSSQLATIIEKDQLLSEISRALYNVMGVDHAYVMLSDADGQQLRLVSQYPDSDNQTASLYLPQLPMTADMPVLSLQPVQPGIPTEWEQLLLDHHLARALALPLRSTGNATSGWIVVGKEATAGSFDSYMIELGQAIATQMDVILQNAHLLHDVRRQAEQFRYMTEFGMTVNSIMEKDELLEVTMSYLIQMLNADYVDVALYNPTRSGLYQVAWQSREGSGGVNVNSELRIDTPDSVVQAVWQGREPMRVDDLQQKTTIHHHIQDDLRSILALPIMSQGNSLGVIEIGSLQPGHFSSHDVSAAQPLIAQLSMSFQNLETYSHGKRLAMAKAVASDISLKLSQQWDVEQIMSVAMSELGRALGAHRGRIRLASDVVADVKADHHESE